LGLLIRGGGPWLWGWGLAPFFSRLQLFGVFWGGVFFGFSFWGWWGGGGGRGRFLGGLTGVSFPFWGWTFCSFFFSPLGVWKKNKNHNPAIPAQKPKRLQNPGGLVFFLGWGTPTCVAPTGFFVFPKKTPQNPVFLHRLKGVFPVFFLLCPRNPNTLGGFLFFSTKPTQPKPPPFLGSQRGPRFLVLGFFGAHKKGFLGVGAPLFFRGAFLLLPSFPAFLFSTHRKNSFHPKQTTPQIFFWFCSRSPHFFSI